MSKEVHKYTNGEVTIIWQPGLCQHSGNCVRGLPAVFDSRKHPWVDANGAGTEQIIAQVNRCPSGALSFIMNKDIEGN